MLISSLSCSSITLDQRRGGPDKAIVVVCVHGMHAAKRTGERLNKPPATLPARNHGFA